MSVDEHGLLAGADMPEWIAKDRAGYIAQLAVMRPESQNYVLIASLAPSAPEQSPG